MRRLIGAVVCSVLGCTVSGLRSPCAKDSDCGPGLTCDPSVNVCVSACDPPCEASQTCANAKCVSTGPIIQAVRVTDNAQAGMNGFYRRDATVSIPVQVDATPGFGGQISTVRLTVNGVQIDPSGPPSVSGATSTYSFTVVTTDAPAGTDGPFPFLVTATDASNNQTQITPSAGLKIDDAGPAVSNIVANGANASPGGVPWFKQLNGGTPLPDIDVTADIVEGGVGLDPAVTPKLVLQSNPGTQVNSGAATPDGTVVGRWHFAVPRVGRISSGAEGTIAFAVVAVDKLGHPQKVSGSTSTLGVDGKPPDLSSFAITAGTNYPPMGTDCDADATLFCGHDGSHFWRRGQGPGGAETTAISFAPVEGGSGIDPASGKCTVAGTTGCTTSFSAGAFSFTPNFSAAAISSPDSLTGGGAVAVSVQAADLVGNVSTVVSRNANVSRIRWIQQLTNRAQPVTILRGSPIVTSIPAPQIIVAGARSGTNDSIVAIKPAGGVLWQGGNSQTIGTVTSNMLYDPTSATDPMLYVVQPARMVALHLTATGPDKFYSCGVSAPAPTMALFGSGATTRVFIVLGGATPKLFALSGSLGTPGSCDLSNPSSSALAGSVGPPTAAGGSVYVAYDNTASVANDLGVVSIAFDGSAFGAPTFNKLLAAPYAAGALSSVSIADDLFFGDGTFTRAAYRFATNFSPLWSGNASTVASPLTVARGLVLAQSGAPTNHITAFTKASPSSAGIIAFTYPASGGIGNISPIATGPDGTLYFSDSGNNELAAVSSGGVLQWSLTGPTDPALALAGVGTEPSLDSNGFLYFGQDSGNVYSIITEGLSPTPPAASGASWPRVGFDNCNSGNSAYANCR
jgi:hypothetical protein